MADGKATGWDRFKSYIGDTWDVVYEADVGDPTEAESNAIMDLGYWGQEITLKTIRGLKAGKLFSEIEKKVFVLRIFAPDGVHTHRHSTKAALIEDAKRYGPPSYPRGDRTWADDDGYTYELEGATIEEVFGTKQENSMGRHHSSALGNPKKYRVFYYIYDPFEDYPTEESDVATGLYEVVEATSPEEAAAKVESKYPNIVTEVVPEPD